MGRKIPNIIYSDFCGFLNFEKMWLEVFIVRLDNSAFWTLEVVCSSGIRHTWSQEFLEDYDAYLAFQHSLTQGKFNQHDECTPSDSSKRGSVYYPSKFQHSCALFRTR